MTRKMTGKQWLALAGIAVAAFVIIIYGTSSHNDKIKTVAENARISIKERKKTPTYEEIVISSGKKEISGEDAILIRYAKTVFEENGLSGVKIVLKNSEGEKDRERTEKSFFVPKAEIAENGYDLSINKYKKTEYVPVEYPPTSEIMADLRDLEKQITETMNELEGML